MKILQFGLGKWGANHNRILKEMGHEVEVAEINIFPTSLHEIKRHDAVIITCSSINHYPILKKCIYDGTPTFCEKPICLKPYQMDEIYRSWKLCKIIFMAGHQVTFLPELKTDTIYMFALRSGAIPREEGAALALMVHDIAVAQYITRARSFEVIEKYGDKHNMKVFLRADSGAEVDILAQSFSPIRIRYTALVRKYNKIIHLRPDNWDRLDLLKLELEEFVAAVSEKRQPRLNDMERTKIVMDTIFKII